MKGQLSQLLIACLLFLSFTLLSSQAAQAQNGTVQGTVTDEEGDPVIGANVAVSGTTRGTATNINGNYTLSVPSGIVKLQFSAIGYKAVIEEIQVQAGQTTDLNITMAEGAEVLNNIIVSATRQPIRKIEATTAVDVLQIKDLPSPTPPSISENIRQVPGVFVENYTGRIRTNIMMRGFPDGTANSVKYSGLLIDGLPAYASAAEPVDAHIKFDQNIERIEVVRGTAATLFGKSTAAGVVNLISKTGGKQLSGTFQQTIGNNVTDSQDGVMSQTDFNLNGPIYKNLRFNVGGFYVNDPGYRDSGFPDQGYQLRGNLDYLLGPDGQNGSIRVYGSRLDMDIQNHVYIPYNFETLEPFEGYDNASSVWAPSHNDITYQTVNNDSQEIVTRSLKNDLERGNYNDGYHFGFRVNVNFAGWTFQNHFRRQEIELGNNFNISSGFNAPSETIPVITGNLFQFVGNTDNEDIINEFQVRKDIVGASVKNSITAGVYYSKNINRPRGQAFITIPGLTPYVYTIEPFTNASGQEIGRNEIINSFTGERVNSVTSIVPVDRKEEAKNLAIFVGDEITINDKLRINAGFRYDRVDLDILFYNSVPFDAIVIVPGVVEIPSSPYLFTTSVNQDRSVSLPTYDEFSYSLGANYLLNENSAIYGNFLRAFRLPDEDNFTGQEPVPNPEEVVEDIINLELGYRGAVYDGDLNYTATFFYTNIDNVINSVFDATTSTFEVRPEGSIRIIGGELALNYTPPFLKGLSLNANLTYQGSEYDDFPDFLERPSDSTFVDVSGNRVQRIAPFLFNFGAAYNHDYFGINVNVNHTGGERFYSPANLIPVDPITLVTLGAHVKYPLPYGTVQLGATVTNLFDVDRPVIFAAGDVTRAAEGTLDGGANLISGAPTLPRRLLFTLSYTF